MNQITKYGSIEKIPLYNCSAHTPSNWYEKDGVARPLLGIVEGVSGLIVDVLYLPMLAVMLEKEHFYMSCYKIMSFLAIVDISSIVINCIITGFLAFQGSVYCSYPNLIYISGMAGMGLWCCSCIIALTLVMNRLLDLIFPNIGQLIFDGNRTFLILLLPLLYGLYFVFFNTPICFTSKFHSWFFDPMIFVGKSAEYANVPHFFNNVFVVAITCCLYLMFCFAVGAKLKNVDNTSAGNRKASTQVFFQSAMICGVNLLASIIYVTMNYIEVPFWLIIVGQLMWQLGNCAPFFIYLKFNRTIRSGLLRKLGIKKVHNAKVTRTNFSTSQLPAI